MIIAFTDKGFIQCEEAITFEVFEECLEYRFHCNEYTIYEVEPEYLYYYIAQYLEDCYDLPSYEVTKNE